MSTLYVDPLTNREFGIPEPRDQRARTPDFTKLTVIIPAFNEGGGVARALQELRDACPEATLLVIDDGSNDDTAEAARTIEGVRVISHVCNRGYGASLKTGIRNCDSEYVAWYDADGQHRPEDLIAVARPVLERAKDAVIGIRGKDSARQRSRTPGKIVLKSVARFVSRERIPDINSGLRCFRRDIIRRYLHLLPDGFSASTTSTLMLLKRGYRVGYVPIVAQPRVGKSTVRMFTDGFRTIQLIIRIIVLFEAFRVFTTLGLMMVVPGFVYGLIVAMARGHGFPTLAGTLIISGILTFFMGIVADQVVELRKERFEDDYAPIDRKRRSTDRARARPGAGDTVSDTADTVTTSDR